MLEWILDIARLLEASPVLGLPVLYMGIVLSGLLMLPLVGWEMICGYVFGPWLGTLVMSASHWLVVPLSVLVGRYFFRKPIERRLEKMPKTRLLVKALEARGPVLMTLVRLSPLTPFGPTNYALAQTGLSIWSITFWTWLGLLPVTAISVVIGSNMRDLSELGSLEQPLWVHGLTLVTVVGLFVVVQRIVTRAMADFEQQNPRDDEASSP